jgi:hypothetical protein
MTSRPALGLLIAVLCLPSALVQISAGQRGATTDLDALMARALAHRDENWKKLDQYVLEEREAIEVKDPKSALLFGDQRDYSWYIRDGVFVRSPVRANGVAVSEADRRKYEKEWLAREKRREAVAKKGGQPAEADAQDAEIAQDVSGLLRQSREPRFVSAGYFLEFKFEPGNYYLAGREQLNGRNVLKVEYLPTNLFRDDDDDEARRRRRKQSPPSQRDREIQEKMNKTAVVTLWVEPDTAEIRRYTFDNLGTGFLPLSWLLRVSEMRADIRMVEPFPGILLPGTVDIRVAVTLANGTYRLGYDLEYHGYKQARSRSTILPSR